MISIATGSLPACFHSGGRQVEAVLHVMPNGMGARVRIGPDA
jgi:hypothetical protein